MGVTERKERHKESLKKEILTAAQELFLEKGWEATSIRNIAERIEYSPATIYLYYKDKNDIVHALHQEGSKLLIAYFRDPASIEDPFERLKAMGRAYMRFAAENQEIYKLLFVMEEPMEHVESAADLDWMEGDRAFDLLMLTVSDCQQHGYFQNMNTKYLSFVIWSTMHGLCTLRTSGHMGHVDVVRNEGLNLDELMLSSYETFVSVLERMKS